MFIFPDVQTSPPGVMLDRAPVQPTLSRCCSATMALTTHRCKMKAWLFAGAALLVAASALAPMAQADGPRASSENNWPGIRDAAPSQSAPHYVWQEGYDHGGKWHGHWVLVH
jgi:hypothetical protein